MEFLNIDKLLTAEYQVELDKLNKKDFSDEKSFALACLNLAKKTAELHNTIRNNFANASLANFVACKIRPLNTQKQLIRFVWDLENMNFN